jgi:hypothetical protein
LANSSRARTKSGAAVAYGVKDFANARKAGKMGTANLGQLRPPPPPLGKLVDAKEAGEQRLQIEFAQKANAVFPVSDQKPP